MKEKRAPLEVLLVYADSPVDLDMWLQTYVLALLDEMRRERAARDGVGKDAEGDEPITSGEARGSRRGSN